MAIGKSGRNWGEGGDSRFVCTRIIRKKEKKLESTTYVVSVYIFLIDLQNQLLAPWILLLSGKESPVSSGKL